MALNLFQHLHQQSDEHRRQNGRLVAGVLILSAVAGCSSRQAPLVIHMYNPKTHQALTCSARDQRTGADASMLAAVVESCAKNLEAQGFIREK